MNTHVQTASTRIAHLSDVHVLEPNPSRSRMRYSLGIHVASIGRPLDASARERKLGRALDAAKRSGADHVVISGDLTELGTKEQFERFAEILHDAHLDPDRITLVPGNHDVYTSADAWAWAMGGPLRAFARSSMTEPGKIVECGDALLLPVDTTFKQPITHAAGRLTSACADIIEKRLADDAFKERPLVLVQHHHPFRRKVDVWFDGLRGGARLMDLLARVPNLFLLHGHLHYVVTRIVEFGKSRIFGAPAIVDDEEDAPRVRLYDVRDGALESVGLSA
jgi:3',5'-cyclic-AMP phosphodiesterase